MWWRFSLGFCADSHHLFSNRSFAQRAKRGTKEPHLTHASLLDQQVDQRSNRPTTAREFFRLRQVPRIHGTPTLALRFRRACDMRN